MCRSIASGSPCRTSSWSVTGWTTPVATATCRTSACCTRLSTAEKLKKGLPAPDAGEHRKASIVRWRLLLALGGDGGIRTPDLYSAIVALSQLSYVPAGEWDYKRSNRPRSIVIRKSGRNLE